MTGDMMADPIPDQDRVRASEARKVKAGGRRMPGGVMPPAAAQALDKLVATEYAPTASGCIHRALIDAAERVRAPRAKPKKAPAKKPRK